MLRRCVVFICCKLDLFISLCNQFATTHSNRVVVLKWIKSKEIECIKYIHNSLVFAKGIVLSEFGGCHPKISRQRSETYLA